MSTPRPGLTRLALAAWLVPVVAMMVLTGAVAAFGDGTVSLVVAALTGVALFSGAGLAVLTVGYGVRAGYRRLLVPGGVGLCLCLVGLAAFGLGAKRGYLDRLTRAASLDEDEETAEEPAAAEEVRDDEYCFVLRHPGAGWRLLGPQDLPHVAPDAIAGAMHAEGRAAFFVSVEDNPEVELEPYLWLVVETLGMTDGEYGQAQSLTFEGFEAVRVEGSGTFEGFPRRFELLAFARGDHVFTLVASEAAGGMAPSASVLDQAFRAFDALPGKIRGRAVQTARADKKGVGWRVRDGRFESAAFGIAADAVTGWSVVGGPEANVLYASAEVVLVKNRPQVSLAVIPWRGRAGAPADVATQIRASTMGVMEATPTGGRRVVRVLGQDVELFEHASPDDQLPMEFLSGVIPHGDLFVEILIWYPPGHRVEVLKALPDALAAISMVEGPELDALRADLGGVPKDEPAQIGEDDAYRAGTYTSFAQGVTWRAPATGYWRVRIGIAVEAMAPGDILYFEEPTADLRGSLRVEEAADEAAFHAQVTEAYVDPGRAAPSERRIPWGKGEARVSRGKGAIAGIAHEYLLATSVVDGMGTSVVIYFPSSEQAKGNQAADEALAGITVHGAPLPVVEREGDAYLDHRLGFALSPPAGFAIDPLPDAMLEQAPASALSVARGTDQMVFIGAQASGVDEMWMTRFAEELLRDKLGGGAFGSPSTAVTVAGQPARRLRYGGLLDPIDVYLFTRNGAIYMLIVDADLAAREELVSSLRFLD